MDSVTYLRQLESCDDIGNGDFSRIYQIADEYAALQAENERLAEALECMIIGACAVAVPHNGERAVLQDAVNIARAALAAYRKGGAK